MATLREIRRQLRSVHNIQKITQAMEMVAASRLRKAQDKAEKARPYYRKLREILDHLILFTPEFVHPLTVQRKVKKQCFVVIAGDKGLCGGYNQAVFSNTEKFLRNLPPETVELIVFGRKTADHFANRKWKIRDKKVGWGGKISFKEIEAFTQDLMQAFLTGEYDEVWLVYTHYINVATREVKIEKLLNIETSVQEKEKASSSTSSYIFEPDVSSVFTELLPRYCLIKVQSALNESYASELGARIFSMRAATKNAEEMINRLTLTRNKLRQSGITKELIEITSGAESLK